MSTRLKNREYWLSFIIVVVYFFLLLANTVNENNTTYALEQINQFDKTIFFSNIAVSTDGLSARFFLNLLVGFFMNLTGGEWVTVCVALVYLAAIVLAFATVEIAFGLSDKYGLFLAPVLAFYLTNDVNTGFPGWGSFEIESIGMGTAYAFAMLAISQVIGNKKRWNAAWLFLAVAAFFHVHEGMWGCVMLVLLLVCHLFAEKSVVIVKKQWGFLVFAVILGISVIPGLFGGNTGLSSAEFVQIYAYYRTPHHLVPSAWGMSVVAKNLLCICAAAVFRAITVYFTNKKCFGGFLLEAGLAMALWFGAYGVIYLFTEVIPVSFVVSMFVPKLFKYIGILSQIWCVASVKDWMHDKQYMTAGIWAVTSFVIVGYGFGLASTIAIYGVCIFAIFMWQKYDLKELQILALVGMFVIIGKIAPEYSIFSVGVLCYFYLPILWEKVPLAKKFLCHAVVLSLMGAVLFCVTTKDKVWEVQNGKVSFVTPSSYLVRTVGEEIYELAKEFETSSESDATFIYESEDRINHWFQLISKRNSFANYKNVPSNQSQIKEWYERVLETRTLFDKTAAELYEMMAEGNVDYILVRQGHFDTFENSELFKLVNASANDQYRVYAIR